MSLEKICKALWVQNNKSDYPPKIHNLEKLLMEANEKLNENDRTFMLDMNAFQLEGRYPDYLDKIYKKASKIFTTTIFEECKQKRKYLLGLLR